MNKICLKQCKPAWLVSCQVFLIISFFMFLHTTSSSRLSLLPLLNVTTTVMFNTVFYKLLSTRIWRVCKCTWVLCKVTSLGWHRLLPSAHLGLGQPRLVSLWLTISRASQWKQRKIGIYWLLEHSIIHISLIRKPCIWSEDKRLEHFLNKRF